jgi:DNA polymerase I
LKQVIFDIEADGLNPTRVWVVVAKELCSGETKVFMEDTLGDFAEYVKKEVKEVIGHNIIGYDIPVCNRLLGVDFSHCKITDTLVMSRLANPQQEGGHSLDNWGQRLGFPKGTHSDWSCLSQDMVDYCVQDVMVNERMYKKLLSELESFGDESVKLEHQVQTIIAQQIENGWLLDQEHCFLLLAELKEKKYELEEQVQKKFIPVATYVKTIEPKVKKDGSFSTVGLKFLGDNWTAVCGEFSRIEFPEFNLGSRQQIGKYLQRFGWKPTEFTDKEQPIVDEKVLSTVKDIPEAMLIAEYLLIQKRIAQVQSWLDAVKDDGRVHGYVNANGAVTGRMTHSSPNMAQVPAVYSPYGKECRQAWTVPKGYSLVGCDASGLELRMLAHYMDDEAYTYEIINGDIHTANQVAAGLPTRDKAKTFIYAFLYGAGDAKIGSIVDGTKRDGAKLKAKFLKNTPSLGALRERVGNASARGYLLGLDGRKLYIRSEHAALNTLLQSAGAIIMKKALQILDEYATIWEIDYKFVGNIHDEIQAEVRNDQSESFGRLAVASIEAAGRYFELRCPLSGEFRLGHNWSETH